MNIIHQLNTTKTSLIPLLCAYISDIENEVYFVKVSKNLYRDVHSYTAEVIVGDLKIYISNGVSLFIGDVSLTGDNSVFTCITTKDVFDVRFIKQLESVSVKEFFEIYSVICSVCY